MRKKSFILLFAAAVVPRFGSLSFVLGSPTARAFDIDSRWFPHTQKTAIGRPFAFQGYF